MSSAVFGSAVNSGAKLHPRSSDSVFGYGTAGFRNKATELDHVMYRVGLLAALRSKVKAGATIGAMITASHNPEGDNGVKVVDPVGEMLEARWEGHATRLVNVPDQDLVATLDSIIASEEIDMGQAANVVVAMDTRPSSPKLSEALIHGIEALKSSYQNYGLLTTPQLHYMVLCINTQGRYGEPTEEGYYKKLSQAFHNLTAAKQNHSVRLYKPSVAIDAANGIGAAALRKMAPYLGDDLQVTVYNDGTDGKLNLNCGADFVKTNQKAPLGVEMRANLRYASFDGDADRIVFYYWDKTFHLLDGDKIATLLAGYLKELLQRCDLDLDLGIVQTAYANGQSTRYIENQLHVPAACVPTGVKHLHHRAQQMDIGVYFEANGHGTVLFSDSAAEKIRQGASDQTLPEEKQTALNSLINFMDLTNQTVGDALSDLLLVETVLRHRDWDCPHWGSSYTDLPNTLLKVKVADRAVVTTTDAERRTTAPAALQPAVDRLVARYSAGRAFVRPSGTEDVVRVYAEAETKEAALWLGYDVASEVYSLCVGVGDKPKAPDCPKVNA